MRPKPSALLGLVMRHLAPATNVLNDDWPYKRLMNGASGRYEGAIVKVTGTTIGFNGAGLPGGRQLPVNAVHGSVAVASTKPGSMPPTTDPMPGKLLAAPKLPLPPVAGPSRVEKPGKPNCVAMKPGPNPKFGPMPPINGDCTNGWPAV